MSQARSIPGWKKEKEKATPGCAGCLCQSEHIVLVGSHCTQARAVITAAEQSKHYACLTGIDTSQAPLTMFTMFVAGLYEIAGTKPLLHVPGMFYSVCLLP